MAKVLDDRTQHGSAPWRQGWLRAALLCWRQGLCRGGPPGRERMMEAGKSRRTALTPGACIPTLPPDSIISRLGVSSTPGSGSWKDTAAQGHTVSKKLCQGLSQEQSDFKTRPPASVLHSLHKEALKKSMWNYIWNQEFAYLKLVAEMLASAARKEEHRESLCSIKILSHVWTWSRQWTSEFPLNEMKFVLINQNGTMWIKCSAYVFSYVRLFVTLWTVARQAPLSMGFSRQEYWSGVPCPPPGDQPDPGIKLASLGFPALADGIFTTVSPWKPSESNNENSILLLLNITHNICAKLRLHAHQCEMSLASFITCWSLWSWNHWRPQAQVLRWWRRWWEHLFISYQKHALFKTIVLRKKELFQMQTTD